jgi:tetratricopeptide (TPR) repeat protein
MSPPRTTRPANPHRHPPVWIAGLAGMVVVGLVVLAIASRRQAGSSVESAPGTNVGASASGTSLSTNGVPPGVAFDSLPDDEKVAALLGRGSKLLDLGNNEGARELYQMALGIDPDDEDIHFNLGIALARLGRTDQAIASYQEALRLFPDYPEVHNNLGNLLAGQGKIAAAIGHFNAALKAAPENASAHNNLGSVLARQGELQKAMEHFETASQLQTNYLEAHYNLASTYLELGKVALAVDKFSEILRQQPDFKPAQNGLERARRRLAEGKP